MSKPWMKFYPSDWRSDPALRMCPLAARGLWMEMLSIMHEAEPYGHLVVKGVAVEPGMLAKMVGIGLKECRNLLATLRQVGVFSETEAGVIYSRRMVRDFDKALKDKENGKKGGNPALGEGVNPQDKAQKPDTRSQIPEGSQKETSENNPETTEDVVPADASRRTGSNAGKYAFEHGTFRLTQAHLDRWISAWPELNVIGLLHANAAWAIETGNPYVTMPKLLAKKDEERKLAVEQIKANAIAAANAPAPKKPAYLGP